MSISSTKIINKNFLYKSLIFILFLNGLSTVKSLSIKSRHKRNFDLFNYNVEKMYSAKKADVPSTQQQRNPFSVVSVSEFVAKIKGGLDEAEKIAKKYNFKLVKQVFKDSDYFLFEKEVLDNKINDPKSSDVGSKIRKRRSLETSEMKILEEEPKIEWIEEQVPLSRKKRDFVSFEEHINNHKSRKKEKNHFNDPMWSKLWYINQDLNGESPKIQNSMRVKEAWKLGYTGKGVVVTILDDGLEWDHPDLIKNYDFRASLDINDGDNDPKPRYDRYNYNKHGTRCAGEIAAVADNNVCSIGVAYNSQIGGIRMLDGEVTDLVEATALSYNRDYIDIYSASWGPDDDGKTVDGPGYLALKAIEDGIKYGRKGLGSIYVWASGNGGKDDDNCNCDGYTNSIYTISVSSATQNGQIPWYSESCSSTIASTFSSGSYEERQIITTDLRKSCTEGHTGTSASAPLAAGIIALTLEANPDLSWRDIQHIIVETAKPDNLSSSDWHKNGVDFIVSHSFGFGLMDALAMVDLAKAWTNVPQQRKCIIESTMDGKNQKPILIPRGDRLIIELYSTGCHGAKNEINFLEHVQAVVSVQSNTRGTLVVYLRSPMGTNSTLLDRRMLDQSTESFNKWPFTTVHMWGERAQGTWILEIKNNAKNTTYLNLNLILYGTKEAPQKRSVKSRDSNLRNPKNENLKESSPTTQKASLQENKPTNNNNKNNYPQSLIDWTNLNGYKINNNFPFQFISQNRPVSELITTTTKSIQFLTNSIDGSYYLIASNKKNHPDSDLTENYPSNDYDGSEDYIDYDQDYNENNIKSEKTFVSGKNIIAEFSTSVPFNQNRNNVYESKIEAIVNNIQSTAQEHKSSYFFTSNAQSGVVEIKLKILYLIFFQLFYKILSPW